MAYERLNKRSIRLFAATPEEIEKHRPNLNSPWFRVKREALIDLLQCNPDGDVVMSIGIWKREGTEGKPPYFTAELSYPPAAKQLELIERDDKWEREHPRTVEDNKRRQQKAINQRAAVKIGVDDTSDLPF